ncbi:DEAD/DEAH box helicase [Vibrio maerlii]|uniref:DEAD/DEAH box helicase n=1 Tax=Vibrio maerlii TaxID=2231648 RepID=UPI000E3C41C3|nr:DEAD/DEAH box helicase [Vibrio maerlii]
MSFRSLSLRAELIQALPKNVTKPTDIQTLAIPALLKNDDVIAMANTGSGKTLAYGLPILQLLKTQQADESSLRALVLVPTRELAMQVTNALSDVASALALNVLSLCGGIDKEDQKQQLLNQPEVVVATAGRLLDLVNEGVVNLSKVQHLVLDEADRLLDMGFWNDVRTIAEQTSKSRQTAMFSATFSQELKEKAQLLLNNPQQITAHQENSVNQKVAETLYLVNKGSKPNALIALIEQYQWKQALVFIGAKDNADKLTKKLTKVGVATAALHGNKSQDEREQTLEDFKSGKINVLIATDLLARGIDIKQLPVVVNYELPAYAETYVHRVGRTARAGKQGIALSLVCHAEMDALNAIRTLTERELPVNELEGFPVTDKPSTGESKRAPRDKKANRRTQNKKSIKQFQGKSKRTNRGDK